MGDQAVDSGRREAFGRSRWRLQQLQDDEAIEVALRESLGRAGELDSSVETLREALILLEARLDEERNRRVAAEAEAALLAAQAMHQRGSGLSARLRRLAGR